MESENQDRAARDVATNESDDPPGVPGFRSWPALYLFVFAAFVAVVIALAIISRVYA
jgi:hypothetical protein